ncbi:hypothetical protein TELCIR_13484 [Teladorsagia circumcincta]|uniref:RNA-directed DNA polymerase n=1 Tax=Teladorsagia circumcincta TaxID=45464 RepID=A0A2G9U5S1_TELCI|nr:hypothetical protein TELCIR_13484 [Teladorsagia circumcincta]
MDADTLRAILDAQAIAQQKTLDTLMDKMEKMFKTTATTPAGTRASTTEFVTNSLSARLPEFTYDPENGCTFDVWYNRRIGHKKGFCQNFNKRRNRNAKKKPRRANQVVVVASTATSAAPVKRIYRTVIINGTPTRMRLDTGADVTLLSLKDWITIGRPKLLPPLFALRSADNKEIKVFGHFQCNFAIEGHEGGGNCHVADTTSLLELDWITQVEPFFIILLETPHQQMDTMIAGLDGTAAYLDDIIVTGKTITEHNARLGAVLRRNHDYGFRVRLKKCSFLQTEIRYLGLIVNAKGRQPDPAQIEAIHNIRPRRTRTSVQLASASVPKWIRKGHLSCKSALTPAQKKYSQIEKEAFALIFAVQKFHRFIHGRHFTLMTDHKPLISIFGNKKGVLVYSANRLQRWATMLLNYNFSIQYVNTKDFGQADALSRLISSHTSEPEDRVIAATDTEITAEILDNCNHLPVSFKAIQAATSYDPILAQVINYKRSGYWPKIDRNSPLFHYYNRRESLSTINGCLLTSSRIVIPKSLQRRVLYSLHKAHPGQTRMKMLARSCVYWPALDPDIEQLVKNCATCVEAAKNPVKAELSSWPEATSPRWTRVHADFAGPLDGYYIVAVDAYSKRPEIVQMNTISTFATIKAMRRIFAQFGNPQTLVTDNGTQFTSTMFIEFCRQRGIRHIRSPPFH